MAKFKDEQVMLCLAALCYRGFSSGRVGEDHLDTVRRRIAAGLESIAPLERDWELVWGPGTYRSPSSLLDDGLMYVARRKSGPPRYVVAIRGTNPVSVFDWVFGDFWTGVLTPWGSEADGSEVSLSSALGLAVLQHLRSDVSPDATTLPTSVIRAKAVAITAALSRPVTQLSGLVQETIAPLHAHLMGLLGRVRDRVAALHALDDDTRLERLVTLWWSEERRLVIEVLGALRRIMGSRLDLALFSLLRDDAAFRASFGDGVELLPFLAAVVDHERRPTDVVVTGHSKGGALAPTLALWLAETQGTNVPVHARWDPRGHATVHCYSYAGPTAGNAAFAKRSDDRIGGRCHRFANPFDVVPHAWAPADLDDIATLYDEAVPHSRTLEDLVGVVAGLTTELGYTQIATFERPRKGLPGYPGVDANRIAFFDQLVYQHMEAYLKAFGLDGLTTTTFFDPLA